MFGEDDLVVTHGVYHGFGPDPLVAFDLWRVVDGRIIEHWDTLQPKVAQTVRAGPRPTGRPR